MRKFKAQQKGFLMSKQMIENLFKPPKEYEKKDREIGNNIETSEDIDSRTPRRDGEYEDLFI